MLSIAVVTPSLNQARFVARTIDSVFAQAYPTLDYVVCDGGSDDGTLDIVERFQGRLRLVSESDRGQADAVNKGIRLTSSELIGWLNSDDVYAANALAAVADYFVESPEVDVVYGDALVIDAYDTGLGRYYTEPWNLSRLKNRCFLCQPAVFFRRRVIERFGMLDERLHYCMDYEYWLRLALGGAVFRYLPVVLAGSRQHPETKTLRSRLAIHDELNQMLRQRLGHVPDSWLLNHAHTLVELDRAAGRSRLVPYAMSVILRSLWLSWRWNGRLSGGLARQSLSTLAGGARRRLSQSRSAATSRPAS